MTIESAAVAFLRASAAWTTAKFATRNLRCKIESMNPNDPFGPCPEEHGNTYPEEWCANCQKRKPLMVERRVALKTYRQTKRHAMRALKQETP
jgi:hypothetical protein